MTARDEHNGAFPLAPLQTHSINNGILPPPSPLSPRNADPRPSRSLLRFQLHGRSRLKVRAAWNAFEARISTAADSPRTPDAEQGLFHFRGTSEPRPQRPQRRESEASGIDHHRVAHELAALPDDAPVDIVVVDRDWSKDSGKTPSEAVQSSPEKVQLPPHSPGSDCSSSLQKDASTRWYRVWAGIGHFFTFFNDLNEDMERAYQREAWNSNKLIAFISSLFLLINWIIGVAIISHPIQLIEIIFYFIVAPVFTVTVPVMIAYDWPRKFPIFYQLWIAISVWSWSIYQVMFMNLCGFYGNRGSHPIVDCSNKDFFGLIYYATALPTIAVMALRHHRISAAICMLCLIGIISGLITPFRHLWIRYELNILCYWAFVFFMGYRREVNERRLFVLREELRAQAIATQQAEHSERSANDAKRRLTSYIFHEVRVPLNTALLAVQNMEAVGNIDRIQEVEFAALQGSLSMMSKVLNDVLDFNRMDAGRFESVSAPYSFHASMRSMLLPLKLAAETRGLQLVVDLDKNIDIATRKALYKARGDDAHTIAARLSVDADDDALVLGDEMRLRQVVMNLASNATKFTPEGGQIMITTKLVSPVSFVCEESDGDALVESPRSDDAGPRLHHSLDSKGNEVPNQVVVRLEVRDTGFGIRPRELKENKLFSPYVQTEIGKQQGGKGTGLGLALVRHIVKLSGGRLGLRSLSGAGSCFWVELCLGVGSRVLAQGGGANITDLYPPLPSGVPRSTNNGHTKSGQFSLDRPPLADGFKMAEGEGMTPSSVRTAGDKSLFASSSNAGHSTEGHYSQSISGQTANALRSIMEQGGRVEMAASRDPDEDPQAQYRGAAEERIMQTASMASLATLPQNGMLPNSGGGQSIGPGMSMQKRTATPSIPDGGKSPRPTYVPLPSRGSFTSLTALATNSGTHSPSLQAAASANANAAVSNTGTRSSIKDFAGLRVLVVDDDFMTRMLMSRMLTRLGCVVHTAENGQIALDILFAPATNTPSTADHGAGVSGFTFGASAEIDVDLSTAHERGHPPRFALILLDNQMPLMTGLDVVKRLRAAGRTDLCVGVTGNALLSDQREYLEAGVDYVLTKPVLEKNLKEKLAMALQRLQQQQHQQQHQQQQHSHTQHAEPTA